MSAALALLPSRPALDGTTLAAVAVTVVACASAFPAIRAGLAGFGPAELGALRFAVAGLPAALFLIVTRPALPRLGELWRFVFGGVAFGALYTLLPNFGERTVAAGAASFVINTAPIITALLAPTLLGERFSARGWAGTGLSFAGIGLIALGESETLALDAGTLLILGAAFCTAFTTVVQKPLFAPHHPLTVSASNLAPGGLCLVPFPPSALARAQTADMQSLGAALYPGLIPSLAAYGAWAVALSRPPAARASDFLCCVPPVATLIGFLWLGELPGPLGLAGGLLAPAGVAVVSLRR